MHDSSTLYVGGLSNSTEPRGNIYVRHRYSIGYVHRPGPRRYFRVSLEHELNIARALHTHFLESHFVHYSPGEFPSQVIIRPRGLPLNARIAAEKLILILTNGRSLSVSVHDPLQDGSSGGFVIPRTTGSRTSDNRDVNRQDDKSGRDVLDVRYAPVCREYALDAPKGGRREKERQRERERKREERQRTREGSAREFAGRLKHGSAVSRPRTRNSTRLRRTSPPSPSALPRGQGVARGRRG